MPEDCVKVRSKVHQANVGIEMGISRPLVNNKIIFGWMESGFEDKGECSPYTRSVRVLIQINSV